MFAAFLTGASFTVSRHRARHCCNHNFYRYYSSAVMQLLELDLLQADVKALMDSFCLFRSRFSCRNV